MSWATNYERVNNVYSGKLPNMSDGRHFKHVAIDQQIINEKNKDKLNIKTNNDYRKYLTENASSIIEKNSLYHYSKTGNPSLFEDVTPKNTPYLFEGPQSEEKPIGYQESDLKNYYLTHEQLNMIRAPSIHVPDSDFHK
tara:strand:- start:1388 stop:1804 length:417 start_codon:yes stop_codon:yes gene_type:complete